MLYDNIREKMNFLSVIFIRFFGGKPGIKVLTVGLDFPTCSSMSTYFSEILDTSSQIRRALAITQHLSNKVTKDFLFRLQVRISCVKMAKRTRKVGITGKYGTRYGASLRKVVKKETGQIL